MSSKRPLIQASTKEYWQQAKEKEGFSFFDRLHGYIYARWIYLYIGLASGNHPLTKNLGPPIAKIGNKADPALWQGTKRTRQIRWQE